MCCARWSSAFPNPTLETFRDLLTNGYGNYKDHIAKLPPDLQDFFHKDFNEKGYADRRREVLQRLRLLLDNDTMRGMLTATSTRFRIGEAMDSGKIVIINNSKARLGDQGAEFFGRFFIAQVLAAAQQRSTRPREQKPPVYFHIDECQNVIARDEKIPDHPRRVPQPEHRAHHGASAHQADHGRKCPRCALELRDPLCQ